ncbi:MAG: alpha/beta hydrolase fold, partial [Dehalococcoidia bacterium]|nr:alpha/beta hydrolase fold [Dehalococcoidia bacterium]
MADADKGGFVKVNGINMHYLEWGRPGNPDLLLVHGWTSWAQSWRWLAEQLQDEYHIIAPDHRGHGESDKPVTGYRLRDFAEDMHQLISALGLKRPLYAGNSWGGCIGTVMAADYHQDLSKVLLGDPVYWKMINAFVTNLPNALARKRRSDDELRKEMREAGRNDQEIEAEIVRTRQFSEDAITRLLTDNRDFAFTCEEYLKRINVPTLIIAADPKAEGNSGYILREEADNIERIASPMVRVVRWSGVGHG